jgi:hypothetical protein
MRCNLLWIGLMVVVACAASVIGCKPESSDVSKDKVVAAPHKHDHNAPGKHGGQQQLLGNHEYHAELAHNETTGEVAIYVTDAEFIPVAVPEKTIFLTAIIDGQPKEFTLSGETNPSGAAGGEPRFVLVDKQLCDAIGKGKDAVRLNATIKGKPYAATYTVSGHADHEHGEKHADEHDEHPGEKHADEHDGH